MIYFVGVIFYCFLSYKRPNLFATENINLKQIKLLLFIQEIVFVLNLLVDLIISYIVVQINFNHHLYVKF